MLPPSEQPNSSSTTTAAAAPQHTLPEPLTPSVVESERGQLRNTCPQEETSGENGGRGGHVGEGRDGATALVSTEEQEESGDVETENSGSSSNEEEEGVKIGRGEEVKSACSDLLSECDAVEKLDEETEAEAAIVQSGIDQLSESDNDEVEQLENVEVSDQTTEAGGGDEQEYMVQGGVDTDNIEEKCQAAVGDLLELEEAVARMSQNAEMDGRIVRASFADFEEDETLHGAIEDTDGRDEEEEDEGVMLMGNPDLQRIREEQVRKWLIFEQENPVGGSTVEGSLTPSMEADSLATGGGLTGQLLLMNGAEVDEDQLAAEQDGGDSDGMGPRRVRFLTDQEGNLLISVFMTNTPTATTPLSEEPSILSNGGTGGYEEVDAVHLTQQQQQSPSLVVSPPSLENNEPEEKTRPDDDDDEELVDSIEPSAPPMDGASNSEDEEEPPSIVLIAPLHQKEPPREKPPAPPTSGEDSANESSDETLSVSSCNSMIEILPNNEPSRITITLDEVERTEKTDVMVRPQNTSCSKEQNTDVVESQMKEENGDMVTSAMAVTPCFQLGAVAINQTSSSTPVQDTENEQNQTSDSPQPASLIVHEMRDHSEGMAARNKGEEDARSNSNTPPQGIKVPNVDENNNVVEDSIFEEEDDDQEENGMVIGEVENRISTTSSFISPEPPQFNPEIGEQVMPELRRSTSSSSGEVEEELERGARTAPAVQMKREEHLLLTPSSPEDEHEAQMVSLCIQEEHISSVAVTIAKWESMNFKAQSTENLSNTGMVTPPANSSTSHAPVTKSASSPCPKTSSAGLLAPSSQQQNKPTPPIKPIQPVVPVQTKGTSPSLPTAQQQVNRLVIHGANSPVSNEPLVVTKAAGWSCWGNKVINNKDACLTTNTATTGGSQPQNMQQDGGNGSDDIIYAQPNHQAGSTMTSIANPSAILKSYPKPLSRGEIVNWLREGEIHRAGLLLNYSQSLHHAPLPGHMSPVLVSWFFGLISRQQAERYLHGQPPGTFLVRISNRIWGYTLSYQASSGRTKHFLISAINPAVPATLEIGPPDAALPPQSNKQQRMSPFLPQGRYAFIGTNMTPYGTLVSLIRHHSHAPITKLGGEKLLNPCQGGPQVAGLETLFQKSAASVAASPTTPSSNNLMISSA